MEIIGRKERNIVFWALTLANIPGVLRSIAEVFAKYNVNILSGLLHAPPESKEAVWIVATDFTEALKRPEEVFDEFRKLNIVLHVDYGVKRFGNILIPPFQIRLNVLEKGVIVQKKSWLKEVNRAIVEEFGSGAEALMFHIGFQAGCRVADRWREASGLSGKELIVLGFETVRVFNWISDYKIVKLNLYRPEIVFRVWDLMDCSPFKGQMKEPTSHYFRGIVSGYISRITGKQVVFVETRCIAKGDPYCEFTSIRKE